MKNRSSRIFRVLRPLLYVGLTLIYLRVINHLAHNDLLGKAGLCMLFAPVALFAILRFIKSSSGLFWKTTDMLSWLLFWGFLYYAWVFHMAKPANRVHMELIYFFFLPNLMLVYYAESYLTVLALLLWGYVYIVLAEKGRFAISSVIIVPAFLTYLLFANFYYGNGVHGSSEALINTQKGVSVFYSKEDFPKIDFFDHKFWTEQLMSFPRKLVIDPTGSSIYVNYAQTFGADRKKMPGLLHIDIATKHTYYYKSYYNRSFALAGDSVLMSPWYDKKIIVLDKETLTEKDRLDVSYQTPDWETVDMKYDEAAGRLYVSNEVDPMLLCYEWPSGVLLWKMCPSEVHNGGFMWNINLMPGGNIMYFIASNADNDVYKFDTEKPRVTETLDLNTFGASALLLDRASGMLFVQDGHADGLFMIEAKGLELKKTIKGSIHSRSILKDPRRPVLYVLSFIKGRLYAVDINTGKRVWSIKTGFKPCGMDILDDTIYLASSAGIVKVSLSEIWDKEKLYK